MPEKHASEDRVDGLETRIGALEATAKSIWDAIDGIKEQMNRRIPLWTTFLISFLTAFSAAMLSWMIRASMKG